MVANISYYSLKCDLKKIFIDLVHESMSFIIFKEMCKPNIFFFEEVVLFLICSLLYLLVSSIF